MYIKWISFVFYVTAWYLREELQNSFKIMKFIFKIKIYFILINIVQNTSCTNEAEKKKIFSKVIETTFNNFIIRNISLFDVFSSKLTLIAAYYRYIIYIVYEKQASISILQNIIKISQQISLNNFNLKSGLWSNENKQEEKQ